MKRIKHVIAGIMIASCAAQAAELLRVDFESDTVGANPAGNYVRPTTPSTDAFCTVGNSGENTAGTGQGVHMFDDSSSDAARLAFDFSSGEAAIRYDIKLAQGSIDPAADGSKSFTICILAENVAIYSSGNRYAEVRLYDDGSIRYLNDGGTGDQIDGYMVGKTSVSLSLYANDSDSAIANYEPGYNLAANSYDIWLDGTYWGTGQLRSSLSDGTTNGLGRVGINTGSGDVRLDYLFDDIVVSTVEPSSAPEIIPDIWFDAADASTIQLSGGQVQQWNDKSGNGFHAIAPASSNRPLYDGTKGSIEFDGVDDGLKIAGGSAYGPGNALTFFVVAQLDDVDREQAILTDSPYSTSSRRFGLHYRPWTGTGYLPLIDNSGLIQDNQNRDLHVVSAHYDGATFSSSIDGSNPARSVTASAGDSGSGDLMLGSKVNLSGNMLDGRIHEILIYKKALTQQELLTIEKSLSQKWGFPLDPSHPFASGDFGVIGGSRFTIAENSPDGTAVGTVQAVSSNPGFVPQGWRISPEGGVDKTFDVGVFDIDPNTGEIYVADHSKLDYEQLTTHRIAVCVSDGTSWSNGIEVNIDVSDVADGDPAKTHSQLWGANGELWNSYSRLPDWSHAGYHWGDDPIPDHAAWPVLNITSYGAVPNDGNDDSAALQAAIDAAPASGAIVYMPAGRFVLSTIVTIGRSNLILRGAGRDAGGTVLYCPVPMADLGSSVLNDHMIRFRGNNGNLGIINSKAIVAEAKRGDRTLLLDSAPPWQPGETVLLRMTDDGADVQGTLWLHLHNDQADFNSDPESYASGTGDWPYTVERVSGKLITFREPLRLDVRMEWQPQLRKRKGISEVGAEDFKMEFPDTPVPGHHDELGYNGLDFKYVSHGWMRRLEFENGDNPVAFVRCHNSTMDDFRLTGRPSHHGPTADYEGNNLIRNIVFDQSGPFIHSITFTHKATGNVCSDISGNQTIKIDQHGNSPMENLFTGITTEWADGSSGKPGSNPHAAHGSTFWNNTGTLVGGLKANYQYLGTSIIGPTMTTDSHTVTRDWHEYIANMSVANIYDAQFARRLNPPVDPAFAAGAFGLRSNWFERDPARWRVAASAEPAYEIIFGEAPAVPGNRLSTYSIFTNASQTQIEMQVQTLEDLFWQPAADVALVLGWQNDENYLYATVSANNGAQIVRVQNGNGSTLAAAPTLVLASNDWKNISFVRTGNIVELTYNSLSLQAIDTVFTSGHAGIGSMLGKAAFKDVMPTHTPASLYADWVALFPTLGSATNWNDDFEPDGMNNLVEYALGADPTLNDAAIKLPVTTIDSNWLYYVYNRHDDAAARGLDYTLLSGTDLMDGSMTNIVAPLSISDAVDGFESVTNRISTDTETHQFMNLEIRYD